MPPLVVQPNVTIAGHTAAGDGITIFGAGLSCSDANNTVTRETRYRIGVGGENGKGCVAPELDAGAAAVATFPPLVAGHRDVALAWADNIVDPAGRRARAVVLQRNSP